jgi:hypothetical protein
VEAAACVPLSHPVSCNSCGIEKVETLAQCGCDDSMASCMNVKVGEVWEVKIATNGRYKHMAGVEVSSGVATQGINIPRFMVVLV